MRVISWEEYTAVNSEQVTGNMNCTLSLTVGVFDGVHRGHQALIQRICKPYPASLSHPENQNSDPRCSLLPVPCSLIPTVVTFRQNPLRVLRPDAFTGDIMNLEEKLHFLEVLGVQLTVLIDFSAEFSKISGRGFIDLLLCRPVTLIALGQNFRCGYQLDTGAEEIRNLAGERGLDYWIAPPVMDEGRPVSSSRIRQALAAGQKAEAERLLGWPLELANKSS